MVKLKKILCFVCVKTGLVFIMHICFSMVLLMLSGLCYHGYLLSISVPTFVPLVSKFFVFVFCSPFCISLFSAKILFSSIIYLYPNPAVPDSNFEVVS